NNRAVNVTAKHSVDIETLCITNDRIFVGADETDGVFYPRLHGFAQRPIAQSKDAANRIHQRVEGEKELITKIAEQGEPLNILHHRVQLVTVQDENPSTVGSHVNGVLLDRNRAVGAEVAGEKLIVVPGNVDDAGALARLAQDLLDH